MHRSAPNSSCRPVVARNTPPNRPTSSPSTTTRGSRRISNRSASFTAWMMFISGMLGCLGLRQPATEIKHANGCGNRGLERPIHAHAALVSKRLSAPGIGACLRAWRCCARSPRATKTCSPRPSTSSRKLSTTSSTSRRGPLRLTWPWRCRTSRPSFVSQFRGYGRAERPGGWVILNEPELHVVGQVMVPDLAGWRRDRMPEVRNVPYFDLALRLAVARWSRPRRARSIAPRSCRTTRAGTSGTSGSSTRRPRRSRSTGSTAAGGASMRRTTVTPS